MSMDINMNDYKDEFESQDGASIMELYNKKMPMTKQKFINRILLIVAILAISFGVYFYYKLHTLQKNPNAESVKEAKDLLGKVAKLYLIPTGEEPTVATVSDPEKLKDQAFFSSAQKDDKVLIFTQAGKAVLYRPSVNKIIEVAPINNKKDAPPPAPEKSTGPLKDKTF